MIKERIPEIEKAAGVTGLVSKWDVSALKNFAGAEKVDVTDELARAFLTPTEKQSKVMDGIKKSEPVPLEKSTN